jgi:sugar phosphate isomerase/epimerase
MKLSFSTLGCHDYNFDQIITCAKKYSFHGVEFRMVESSVNLWEIKDFTPSFLSVSRKKIEDTGLEVPVIGASGSFAKAGLVAQKKQMTVLKRYAEIAQGLGSPYIRIYGGPIPEGQTKEESIKWDIEGYTEAVPLMQKYGVTLLFETHDDFSTSSQLLPLLEGLNGKIGVIWDIIHPYRFGESLQDTWKYLNQYIKHVHIKDAMFVSDKEENSFAFVGEGVVPVREMIEILKTNGWEGFLSFEWERGWHPEIAACDLAFPSYVSYMKRFL